MKILVPILCLGSLLLAGCTTVTLETFHLLGAKTEHESRWDFEDSQTNRAALADALKSVAVRLGFLDNTESKRQEMVKIFNYAPEDVVACYVANYDDVNSRGIVLYVIKEEGRLKATLYQQTWPKTKSKLFIQIRDSLAAEFMLHLGTAGRLRERDDVMF